MCVLEKLEIPGGLAASHAYIPDAPDHLLSLGAMDDMFMAQTPLAADLGLAAHGYATVPLDHPYGWIDEDGETLLLWRDVGRAIEEIKYFSPTDARTYADLQGPVNWIMDLVDVLFVQHPSAWRKRDFARYLLRHRPDRPTRRLLGQLAACNAFEWIGGTFESDAMRGLWAYWASMIGPADAIGSGAYVLGFAPVHRGPGVLRPRGGMSTLARSLQGACEADGGVVRIAAPVAEIVVTDGRATGVQLVDGSVITARSGVLSTAAPQVTFGPLLDPSHLTQELHNRIAMVPSSSINVAAFKIDAAFSGRVGFPVAEKRRAGRDGEDIRTATLMTGTLEEHIAHMNAMKVGLNVVDPPVYMAVLSAVDASLAPEGGDVLYLHSNTPLRPDGGWEHAKAAYDDQVWTSASRFLGGWSPRSGAWSPRRQISRAGSPHRAAPSSTSTCSSTDLADCAPRAGSAATTPRSPGSTWLARPLTRAAA